jgi:hypothetical protein
MVCGQRRIIAGVHLFDGHSGAPVAMGGHAHAGLPCLADRRHRMWREQRRRRWWWHYTHRGYAIHQPSGGGLHRERNRDFFGCDHGRASVLHHGRHHSHGIFSELRDDGFDHNQNCSGNRGCHRIQQ